MFKRLKFAAPLLIALVFFLIPNTLAVFANENRELYNSYIVSYVNVFQLLYDDTIVKEYRGNLNLKEQYEIDIDEILLGLFDFLENANLSSGVDVFDYWFDFYFNVELDGINIEQYLLEGKSFLLGSEDNVHFNVFFRFIEIEEEEIEEEIEINFDLGYKANLNGESSKLGYLQNYINYNFRKFNVRSILNYNEAKVYLSYDIDTLLDFFMFLNNESNYIEIGNYIFTFYDMSFRGGAYSKTVTVYDNIGSFTLLEDYYIYIFFEVELLEMYDYEEEIYEYEKEYEEELKKANALDALSLESELYTPALYNYDYNEYEYESTLFLYFHLKYSGSFLIYELPHYNLGLRLQRKT